MSKMLDAEDIIKQKFEKEIEKLEKELTVLRGRNEALADNLDRSRNQVKELLTRTDRFVKTEKDFENLKKVLMQISMGEVKDPVAYAKKKLEDL